MVQSCHGTNDQEASNAMRANEITIEIRLGQLETQTMIHPPQKQLETHHCAKRNGQSTISTLAKLAKEIGAPRHECQLAI